MTKDHEKKALALEDGSCIAVIGGGPSGSFFTYFALEFADRYDLDIEIDIIEPKDFNSTGPAGCNNCGGIISESLIQMLSAEGIVLPSRVVQRGIESYTLHLEQGSSVIDTPFNEQRIAAIFRGFGPKGSTDSKTVSFDNHLLELCKEKGANIIHDKVTEVERQPDGILVKTKTGTEKKYDLVVGAVGLNQKMFEIFHRICPSFIAPHTTRTHICEFHLGNEKINEYFGNSMHVFLLNLPNITFGALIPKDNYVTMVLLGSDINTEVVAGFLKSEAVRSCFPSGTPIEDLISCNCFPYINVRGARSAYSDRVVLIGDSSTSKLYKNGIGAAYITAKAAARTAIFEGISETTFRKFFQPVCTQLQNDNNIGKFIFLVTKLIQRSNWLKTSLLHTVIKEQNKERHKRLMSSVLWDTFTGSATYRNIFIRFLHPVVISSILWNLTMNFKKKLNDNL